MHHLNKLISKDLVVGLPKLKFEKYHICEGCQKGKQIKHSFKLKNVFSTSKPPELLHMDLFGHSKTMSLGGNYYALVIVDDFSRFTWTLFLESKSDAFSAFKKLAKRLQNINCSDICAIRNHGGNFKMKNTVLFVKNLVFSITFLLLELPNKIGLWKGKTDLLRNLLEPSSLPKYFWVDAVSPNCYVMNQVLIRPILKKTPYELFNGRKPNIGHLKVFGCKCYILNNGKENLG